MGIYVILSIREIPDRFYTQMSLFSSQDVMIMYIVFINMWYIILENAFQYCRILGRNIVKAIVCK